MKVAIIGSRSAVSLDFSMIETVLPKDCSEIVSGGAAGVDQLAKKFARQAHLAYTEFLPEYNRYGKSAPLRRNEIIVDYSDFVLAFWDYKSSGTRSVLLYCVKQNKPFQIVIL